MSRTPRPLAVGGSAHVSASSCELSAQPILVARIEVNGLLCAPYAAAVALDQKQVERAVLEEVIDLHPDHLTPSELVLKMSGERDEDEELRDAIRDLEGSGLVRRIGGVVAPTHAALRAATLFAD